MTTENGTTNWIELDGAVNARAVVPGVLLRSDNLQDLSDRDVRALVDEHGVEAVLDLRTGVEVELEGPGPLAAHPAVRIEHRSLYPESGAHTDLDADTIRPWGNHSDDELPDEAPIVRAYFSYLQRRPDSIVESVRTIANADGAVLVHCAAGKDRTGVVVALALDAVAFERSWIIEDYLLTTERIDAILERLRSTETYRAELEGHDSQRHAPVPGAMERVLELIDERYGGSVAWLLAHGMTEAELERLGRRLLV